MVGPQDHRDALVGLRDPVVVVPVRAAPPRGGAEDVSAHRAEGFRAQRQDASPYLAVTV